MITDKGEVFGINDMDRIDFLQASEEGYGRGWIFRRSSGGRGMRLHETGLAGASPTVRGAIDQAIRAKVAADYASEVGDR